MWKLQFPVSGVSFALSKPRRSLQMGSQQERDHGIKSSTIAEVSYITYRGAVPRRTVCFDFISIVNVHQFTTQLVHEEVAGPKGK